MKPRIPTSRKSAPTTLAAVVTRDRSWCGVWVMAFSLFVLWPPDRRRNTSAIPTAPCVKTGRRAGASVVVLAQGAPLLLDLLLLLLLLAQALLVAGRQLELVLGGDAALELPRPLYLGVDLRPEQQGQVGDPQPEKEDDHAGEGAVRLVVAAEVGDVEAEDRRCHDPHHDGDQGAGADPAELGLLHVGRGVVEDRDDEHHHGGQDRPLGDVPHA